MATKNRADILALINAYTTKVNNFITTNGNREITGAQLNEILNDNGTLLNDIKDSYYSLLDDFAEAVNYTPAVSGDWNAPTPTQTKAGLDQLGARTKILEGLILPQSLNFVVVDFTNGNDSTAQVGSWTKIYKTGNAAFSAVSTNGTIYVVNGVGTAITVSSKNVQIVGFGNSINSIVVNTANTVNIHNLNITSGSSVQISGGATVNLYNCVTQNLIIATDGGNYNLYNCDIQGTATYIVKAYNTIFRQTAATKNETIIDIKNCTFINTNPIIVNNLTISDKTGGVIAYNTFQTLTNIPILWQKGFNSSQVGQKIELYGNNFIGTSTYVIQETGANTASMKMRAWGNYYEQNLFADITVNELLINYNNLKFS